MRHEFTVYGTVRGQGRPRVDFTRRRTYKPKEDRDYERKIKEAYVNSGGGYFGDKPLAMVVISHRQLPESKPKRITHESDTCKPDASNILKSVEDALNKLAYHDDSQIVCPIPLKMPRKRGESDYIEVIISDEINEIELLDQIRGMI